MKRCWNCGHSYQGRGEKYCSLKCAGGSKAIHRYHWEQCSNCWASLGFGTKKTASYFMANKGKLIKHRRENNIKTIIPEGGSWLTAAKIIRRRRDEEKKIKLNHYHNEWMKEVREASRFPDWSSIGDAYCARKRWNSYYHSLTKDERDRRNKASYLAAKTNPAREAKQKEWRKINATKIKTTNAKYRINNPDKFREYGRRQRRKPETKIASNLRRRLRDFCIKGARKDSTREILGCSPSRLRRHLESQFIDGMSWENYGVHGWHIDHIMPCSKFDLTNPDHVKICFNWQNLQPLWAKDNLKKSDSLTKRQLSLPLAL